MNFSIPRKNYSEMILYIWKIIELPNISRNDLLYTISFELFLFSPKDADHFIKIAVNNGYLILDKNDKLRLSDDLALELENWHAKRRSDILERIKKSTRIVQNLNNFKKNGSNKFNTILKALLDTGTINRAVLVSDSAIKIITFDPQEKIVKAEVEGSKKTPYIIEISANEKIIKHNCHDFQTKRAHDKKFCKHLAKLFLMLKEKDEKEATLILEAITKDINKWKFII